MISFTADIVKIFTRSISKIKNNYGKILEKNRLIITI